MMRNTRVWCLIGATVVWVLSMPGLIAGPVGERGQARAEPRLGSVTPAAARAFIDTYCVSCHNERVRAGSLELDAFDLGHVAAGAEVLEKVIKKLSIGLMPPDGVRQPAAEARGAIVQWLESEIDRAAVAAPNPGRPAVHRLNRTEYANAIRDLLALDVDATLLLPPDDAGFGFDNIGDVLTMSPGLLERYLSAARKIARLSLGDTSMRAERQTYEVSALLLQDDRLSEDLPFGSRGGLAVRHPFPMDGEYVFRIHLQKGQTMTGQIRGLDESNEIDLRLDGARVKSFTMNRREITPGMTYDGVQEDAPLEARASVKAGTGLVGIALLKPPSVAREGIGPLRMPVGSSAFQGTNTTNASTKVEMGIDRVEIEGPFNPSVSEHSPSRTRLFVCRPADVTEEDACARAILAGVARRAYRRPVVAGDIETLLTFFRAGRRDGDFASGIRSALERVLVAPDFLFRVERDPAGAQPEQPVRVSDLELASRLSFFLWSSIPDEELLSAAERGTLGTPGVLEDQVRRMLRDERSQALLKNFFGQWLYLRNLSALAPDHQVFPIFDENLREGFQRETEMFLESQVREDRPITELLTADYTFLNERLARHYGIPNIYGGHFRRVALPDDRRAGLLGQGSILTVTSYANRTSPVLRGKWLLENILGAPPPAPPPNVPPFPENDGTTARLSVRGRMEQHRKNPVCASCHARMDPLGFAFENFDAIGTWRTTDEGSPIDASGVLPSGAPFSNPSEFRGALLRHERDFVITLTGKLLTYAMGRGVEYFDMPAVRAIARDTAAGDLRWSVLISEIVKSAPFQLRRAS